MNDSLAISVQNISKKYRLFGSVKERFLEALHPFDKQYHHEFWALQDISFDVPKGSTVGIIGRNGSGKSTLLQIITSVLQPTSGHVKVDGKISALLELGSGFNPEVTGRENVLFQGEIMGFTRKEMIERLPAIEEFADIGEFIDQPVKIYSSGMFVRLAFAAAINVDPDILIIDEALAVGDAKFRNKCFRKFREFQDKNLTILFVSHDLETIVRHCTSAILVDQGKILEKGNPKEIYIKYKELILSEVAAENDEKLMQAEEMKAFAEPNFEHTDTTKLEDRPEIVDFMNSAHKRDCCPSRNSYNKNEHRFGNKEVEIVDYLVVCGNEFDPFDVISGAWIDIYVKLNAKSAVYALEYGFAIKTTDGIMVFGSNSNLLELTLTPIGKECQMVYRQSIKMDLNGGDYFFTMGFAEKTRNGQVVMDARHELIHLEVKQEKHFDGIASLDAQFAEFDCN